MDGIALGDVLTWASSLALAVALAACAGLRAWLPLFVAGALARLELAALGDSFEWLGSTPALIVFGAATVIEIVADKVPALDHALDAVSTVIRPAAGAVVSAAVLVRIDDPLVASVIGLVVGAPVALAPHVAKASVRAVSTGSTAGLANPVLSALEDVAAIVLAVLAFVAPILIALVLIASAVAFARWLRRRRHARAQRPAPREGQGRA